METVRGEQPADGPAVKDGCPLAIRLLGPFEVRVRGELIAPLRTRKDAWLLALLLLRHDREVDRAWLCASLWPESAPEDAAYNLRRSLAGVRRALGDAAYHIHTPTPHSLRLIAGDADVDLLVFDAAISRGDIRSLQTAVALYQGPLLEGCLEAWVLPERAVRERACLNALESLADHALNEGDPQAAVARLRRAVIIDPLCESAQRRLMQALASVGEFAAAKAVHRDLRQLLHRELNAEPDRETSALWERIQELQRRRKSPRRGPALPGCVPRPVSSLVGREAELQEIGAGLSSARLLTLTGPGGVGKTRLAIRAAEEQIPCRADGVFFVELAPLADGALLPQVVAEALRIREHAFRPVIVTLMHELQRRSVLLVLDNCEHLVDACAQLVNALLRGCPNVRIMATSRQSLGIPGERVCSVPPLSLPPEEALSSRKEPGEWRGAPRDGSPEWLLEWDAVRLFVERAWEARKDLCLTPDTLSRIVEIVRRLDGVPLAIELAATRLRTMSVQQLLERLDDRFSLLTMGSRSAPARAQTLRATVDWSYGLLSASEKALLLQLSVFSGGWTLEAAEQVCGQPQGEYLSPPVIDGLTQLVDRSLVVYEENAGGGTGGRYRMLETIREYGWQRLVEAGEADLLQRRHYAYFLSLADRLPPVWDVQSTEDLDCLVTEQHNVRAALAWCVDEDPAAGVRLLIKLDPFWVRRDRLAEACDWLSRLLERGSDLPVELRAEGIFNLGEWKQRQQDFPAAEALYEQALALIHEDRNPLLKAVVLLGRGRLHLVREDSQKAIQELEEGSRLVENAHLLPESIYARTLLGVSHFRAGDMDRAAALGAETLALARDHNLWHLTGEVLDYLGDMALARQDYSEARRYHREKLEVGRALGDQVLVTYALCDLANVALREGGADAVEAARVCYQEGLGIARQVGWASLQALCLNHLGRLAYLEQDWDELRRACVESLTVAAQTEELERIASGIRRAAALALGTGYPLKAAAWLGAAAKMQQQISPLRGAESDLTEVLLLRVRATLEEMAFRTAWEAGQRQPQQEVVAEAMGWSALSQLGAGRQRQDR